MMVFAAWGVMALAASPGGFRVGSGKAESFVSTRTILVVLPQEQLSISQTTLSGQTLTGRRALGVEVPVLAGWGGGWRDTGLGNIRFSGRYWLEPKTGDSTLGIELGVPVHRSLQTQVWGGLAREGLAGWDILLVAERSIVQTWCFTIRTGVGVRQWPDPFAGGFPVPSLELAGVVVAPISGPVSAVLEMEILVDPTPATTRFLGRVDISGFSIDAGVQIPYGLWSLYKPSTQLLAQARHRW